MARAKDKRAKGPPPAPDIYVALLYVGLAAMLAACGFLMAELNNYQWAMPA